MYQCHIFPPYIYLHHIELKLKVDKETVYTDTWNVKLWLVYVNILMSYFPALYIPSPHRTAMYCIAEKFMKIYM